MEERPHFLKERCTYTITRYPWITAILCITSITLHYVDLSHVTLSYSRDHCGLLTMGEDAQVVMAANSELSPSEEEDTNCLNSEYWYTPISYSLAHVSQYHLWQNVIVLAISGAVLELTESNARVLLLFFISAPLAAGARPRVPKQIEGHQRRGVCIHSVPVWVVDQELQRDAVPTRERHVDRLSCRDLCGTHAFGRCCNSSYFGSRLIDNFDECFSCWSCNGRIGRIALWARVW